MAGGVGRDGGAWGEDKQTARARGPLAPLSSLLHPPIVPPRSASPSPGFPWASVVLLALWCALAGVFIGRLLPALPLPGRAVLVVVAALIAVGVAKAALALRSGTRGAAAAPPVWSSRAAAPVTAPGAAEAEPVAVHADARGIVLEPATPGMLPAQRNVHLVTTAPGAVRGNHYHARGTEVAVVVGPALVRLRENDVVHDVEVPAGAAWRFTIPPRVSHAFQNTGDRPMVLVAFNTVEHDPANPDVFRDVLIEPPA